MEMDRHRNYCFTSYLDSIKPNGFTYTVYGNEICPDTGRKHIQGYIEFADGKSIRSAQKHIGDPKCHMEPRKGTSKEASDYCKKEGDFIESGKISKAGERTDLQAIKDAVLNGTHRMIDMLENDMINNFQQLKFGEGLQKYVRPKERAAPDVYWNYGLTGSGKTRGVYDKEGFDIFRIEVEMKWFDGYDGQEVALFDEFRGQMTLATLLQVTDRYPVRGPQKGGFVNFSPKRIYITSSKSPEECYKNCEDENLQQLVRRCKEINFYTEVGGNTKIINLK